MSTNVDEFCECGQQCLRSLCQSSDSGRAVLRCWCPDCAELRAEIERDAYRIIEIKQEVTR